MRLLNDAMTLRIKFFAAAVLCLAAASCQKNDRRSAGKVPSSLSEVPAARLNFRYEPDVPGPTENNSRTEERNAAVQADFDQNRPQEGLDKTLTSPDKKHLLAVYHHANDISGDYRLDMYSTTGKLLRKMTPDTMAVQYPDTIVWSPDSSAVAFAAKVREGQNESEAPPLNPQIGGNSNESLPAPANVENTNVDVDVNKAMPSPTPTSPIGVLVFRTLQLYTCNAEGENTKALTQNEGLIYFYFAWSPDSSALAALAATAREWEFVEHQADSKGEVFTPLGRLRVVEKNGRERRLDDALTAVWPVWSPDSAKIADGFETQVRIYDATGNGPTQAAIPLRNQLLLSSRIYDRDQQKKLDAVNNVNGETNAAAVENSNSDQTVTTTLPDEKSLVSFNPIIELSWTADNILYFRTAYVKRMKVEADSRTSFARWHRLIFSYQPTD
jgi:hypothetical protein